METLGSGFCHKRMGYITQVYIVHQDLIRLISAAPSVHVITVSANAAGAENPFNIIVVIINIIVVIIKKLVSYKTIST